MIKSYGAARCPSDVKQLCHANVSKPIAVVCMLLLWFFAVFVNVSLPDTIHSIYEHFIISTDVNYGGGSVGL